MREDVSYRDNSPHQKHRGKVAASEAKDEFHFTDSLRAILLGVPKISLNSSAKS